MKRIVLILLFVLILTHAGNAHAESLCNGPEFTHLVFVIIEVVPVPIPCSHTCTPLGPCNAKAGSYSSGGCGVCFQTPPPYANGLLFDTLYDLPPGSQMFNCQGYGTICDNPIFSNPSI